MTQARSASQSQVVQVQVGTGRGRGRRGTQAGERCVLQALLLLQLLLQTADLPQVRLHQRPLCGNQGARVRAGPGCPRSPPKAMSEQPSPPN